MHKICEYYVVLVTFLPFRGKILIFNFASCVSLKVDNYVFFLWVIHYANVYFYAVYARSLWQEHVIFFIFGRYEAVLS